MNKLLQLTLALVLAFTALAPLPLQAISAKDLHAVIYDTNFYDETDASVPGDCFGSGSAPVPSSVKLPTPIVTKINALKSIYVTEAQTAGIPWQMLAAIDFRESNNNPNTSMLGGEPLGTKAADSNNVPQTKAESIQMGLKILKGNLAAGYKVELKLNPSADELKKIFVTYNRGVAYFRANTPADKSPYVMNQFDDAHMDMVFPSLPGETLAGRTDHREGAFTIYSALAGVPGGSCDGTSNVKIVAVAQAELAKNVHESPDGSNAGGRVDIYTDGHPEFWCADFVSWVYKEAGSPFTGGSSGGWRLPAVSSLISWLKAKGVYVEQSPSAPAPMPGDVITFRSTADTDTNSGDHTGIIETVKGETITTIEGNSSNSVARRTYNYKTSAKIAGWGRMK